MIRFFPSAFAYFACSQPLLRVIVSNCLRRRRCFALIFARAIFNFSLCLTGFHSPKAHVKGTARSIDDSAPADAATGSGVPVIVAADLLAD